MLTERDCPAPGGPDRRPHRPARDRVPTPADRPAGGHRRRPACRGSFRGLGPLGLLVLVPFIRPIETGSPTDPAGLFRSLARRLPPKLFRGRVVVAVMIIPIVAALTREVFATTPRLQREAVLALGGTRWDVIRRVVLPIGRTGLLAAVLLGLGRAIGETIAVTMVIGNAPKIGGSIFSPGFTLASVMRRIQRSYGAAPRRVPGRPRGSAPRHRDRDQRRRRCRPAPLREERGPWPLSTEPC